MLIKLIDWLLLAQGTVAIISCIFRMRNYWQSINRFWKAASYKWKKGGTTFWTANGKQWFIGYGKNLALQLTTHCPWYKLLQGFVTRLHIKYSHSHLTWLLIYTSWTVKLTPNFAKGQKNYKVPIFRNPGCHPRVMHVKVRKIWRP